MTDSPNWLYVAREIFSLSQAGIAYSTNEFDLQRYKRLQEICAEMIAGQSLLSREAVMSTFSMQSGYATPKVDVRGAVMRDGRVLLVREKTDGKWAMPGGWADPGDSPAQMAVREVWEESGLHVRVDKLIGVYNNMQHQPDEFFHAYKLIFQCGILSGEAHPGEETLEADFFAFEALPPLSERRTSQRMLQEVFAHYHDAQRHTFYE